MWQDKGYAWIILACSVCWFFVVAGTHKSLGVLYVDLLDLFQEGAFATSLVSTVFTFAWCLPSPLIGCLVDRVSARTLVICGGLTSSAGIAIGSFAESLDIVVVCFGFVSGVSMAMMEVPLLTELSRYFNKKKGLASGMSYTGASLGAVVFPLLFNFFTDVYSVRGTILLLSGLWLNCCVIGALLRPAPIGKHVPQNFAPNSQTQDNFCSTHEVTSDKTPLNSAKDLHDITADKASQVQAMSSKLLPEKLSSGHRLRNDDDTTVRKSKSQSSFGMLLCNCKFLRTLFLTFCGGFAAYGSTFILPALAIEWGLSKFWASLTVSITAAFEVVSRVLVALFTDKKNVQKHLLLFVSFLNVSISGIITFFGSSTKFLIAHAVMLGLCGLNFTPLVVPIISECVKPEQLGSALGLYILALGGGIGAAYPFLGAAREVFSSFSNSLLLSSCFYLLGSMASAVDVPFRKLVRL